MPFNAVIYLQATPVVEEAVLASDQHVATNGHTNGSSHQLPTAASAAHNSQLLPRETSASVDQAQCTASAQSSHQPANVQDETVLTTLNEHSQQSPVVHLNVPMAASLGNVSTNPGSNQLKQPPEAGLQHTSTSCRAPRVQSASGVSGQMDEAQPEQRTGMYSLAQSSSADPLAHKHQQEAVLPLLAAAAAVPASPVTHAAALVSQPGIAAAVPASPVTHAAALNTQPGVAATQQNDDSEPDGTDSQRSDSLEASSSAVRVFSPQADESSRIVQNSCDIYEALREDASTTDGWHVVKPHRKGMADQQQQQQQGVFRRGRERLAESSMRARESAQEGAEHHLSAGHGSKRCSSGASVSSSTSAETADTLDRYVKYSRGWISGFMLFMINLTKHGLVSCRAPEHAALDTGKHGSTRHARHDRIF